jgi:gluconate 5-dehydrogenase
MRLARKTALITGATRGIGAELARAFAREGANVWLHGRETALGEALAAEIGGRFVAADLADSDAVRRLVKTMLLECPTLDILVNNAGMESIMPFPEFDFVKLDRMWSVNVSAAARLIHGLLPALRASGAASVINVTSIHQTVPYPHNAAYCMTKAALGMLTQVLAIELAPLGIRVNNLAPGAVETDINREVVESMRELFAEWIPAGRVAQPSEMSGAAIFLASAESGYVTGSTIVADGGYSHNLVRYRP